jgi:hypothetical protein
MAAKFDELLLDQFLDRIAEVQEIGLDALAEPPVRGGEAHAPATGLVLHCVPRLGGGFLGGAAKGGVPKVDIAEASAVSSHAGDAIKDGKDVGHRFFRSSFGGAMIAVSGTRTGAETVVRAKPRVH